MTSFTNIGFEDLIKASWTKVPQLFWRPAVMGFRSASKDAVREYT
jgi:hypothetical protein